MIPGEWRESLLRDTNGEGQFFTDERLPLAKVHASYLLQRLFQRYSTDAYCPFSEGV